MQFRKKVDRGTLKKLLNLVISLCSIDKIIRCILDLRFLFVQQYMYMYYYIIGNLLLLDCFDS